MIKTGIVSTLKAAVQNLFARRLLLSSFTYREASWMKADVASFVNLGYCGNVYVYSVIRQIATRCASIPWTVYRVTNQKALQRYKAALVVGPNRFTETARQLKDEALEADDSNDLNDIFTKPNPLQSWSEFVEALVSWKNIGGEVFLLGFRPEGGPNASRFLQIYPVDPRLIQIEAPEWPADIVRYIFKGTRPVNPADILHLKYFNPQSPRVGLSPIVASNKPIMQSNGYFEWNTALVQNQGRIPGVLKVKVQKLTQEQRDQIHEEWNKTVAGGPNVGHPFVTANDMDFQDLAFKPHDMDWTQGMNLSAKQIAIAFDWPSQLIGDPDVSKYSNVSEMIRYAYFGKIIPEMDSLRDGLNRWLVPSYKTGNQELWLDYSLDDIEILQEERNAVHQRSLQAFQSGTITLDEFLYETGRAQLGPEKGGDVRLLPMGYSPWDPLQEAGLPTDQEFAKALEDALADRGNGEDPLVTQIESLRHSISERFDTVGQRFGDIDRAITRQRLEINLPEIKVESPTVNVGVPQVNIEPTTVNVQPPQVNLVVESPKSVGHRVRVIGEDGKLLRTLEIESGKGK